MVKRMDTKKCSAAGADRQDVDFGHMTLGRDKHEPRIEQLPFRRAEDQPDDPDKLRWRAWWQNDYQHYDPYRNGPKMSICLQAYPVARRTPQGAWIDPHSYLRGDEWVIDAEHLRWVSDFGSSAWAKPTRREALHSLAYRLHRWAQKLHNETARVAASIDSLRALCPEHDGFADSAEASLRRTSLMIERKAAR